MKYRAGISGDEYAAMEDGYEQGRAAGLEEARREVEAANAEVERVTRVFGEANVELNEKYDRVGEELDDLRERVGAVLDATEWNDWPGRHRLVRRLLAVVGSPVEDEEPRGYQGNGPDHP